MRIETLESCIDRIAAKYEDQDEIFFTQPDRHMPSRTEIIEILKGLRNVLLPGYFNDGAQSATEVRYFIGSSILGIKQRLIVQVCNALHFRDGGSMSDEVISERAHEIVDNLLEKLPDIQELLFKDIQAFFDGDPAAQSKEEIVYSYPGFFAIWVYRIAHELYIQDVPLIPRVMTEYAHSRTGVDINAGAQIGEYFFIDHATGVVIGETTVIGDHVKIYQGVTLGALSTRGGQRLAGVRRHPTIEDNVTIYSNASVLGGETVIGEGSVIAGSAFVTESVPAGSRVSVANQKVNIR